MDRAIYEHERLYGHTVSHAHKLLYPLSHTVRLCLFISSHQIRYCAFPPSTIGPRPPVGTILQYSSDRWSGTYSGGWEGAIPNLMRRYKQTKSNGVREWIEQFMSMRDCMAIQSLMLINCSIHSLTPLDFVCLYLLIKFGIAPSHPPL